MKKKISLLCLSIMTFSLQAQFKATMNGLTTENGDAFYVVNIQGKNAEEIFNSVKTYIVSTFRNPDAVSNEIKNQTINLHGIYPEVIPVLKWAYTHYADVDMNLIMHFKDEKIRFDIPSINQMKIRSLHSETIPYHKLLFSGNGGVLLGEHYMYNKKGKVTNQMAIEGLETFINNTISSIIEYVKGNTDSSDW